MSGIREAIAFARRVRDEDPHLANYSLRDTPEVEAAGLRDLSWEMHEDAYLPKGDVDRLIGLLEAHLDGGILSPDG